MTHLRGERRNQHRLGRLPLVAGLAALTVMSALTVVMSVSHTSSDSTRVAVADAATHSATVAPTPAVPSAAPTMKVQPFQGNWVGGGPFHGGGWPGS